MDANIPQLRQRIDQIDSNILSLLKERLRIALKIGSLKPPGKQAKWDQKRETEIYERLRQENGQDFPDNVLRSIFHEIITTCRRSQEPTKVAYLGPEATFSHLAGVKYFGHAATYHPMENIDDVFADVEKERCHYGIVPVENSIEGAVVSTLDSFMKHRGQVWIRGEVKLEISLNLACRSGDIKDVRIVASHSQPLAQCREWLQKYLPSDVQRFRADSTSVAAQMAANNPNIGAIASSLAIKQYELQMVATGIEDFHGNTTRFLVIGKEQPEATGNDLTSLLIGLPDDRPGALNEILTILSKRSINLTKLESRPEKGKLWQYLFFIDMIGHRSDENIAAAMREVEAKCSHFTFLGSYPRCDFSDEN
ncbi:MAG: prephenate dehydratase [Desulfobulbaceae bacterium]|jgi:chorismate mutase/prephenate dehydratase|nr:prephenate dehydratase [Desulfobulbaceae bacterium]